MDQQLIEAACIVHGPKAIYAAAYAAIFGRRCELVAVGVGDVRGHNALSTICSLARGKMSVEDRNEISERFAPGVSATRLA